MGKCLKDNLGAMLKMAREDLLEDPPSGKEGRNNAKIGSIRSKGSPARRGVVSNVPNNVRHLEAQTFR